MFLIRRSDVTNIFNNRLNGIIFFWSTRQSISLCRSSPPFHNPKIRCHVHTKSGSGPYPSVTRIQSTEQHSISLRCLDFSIPISSMHPTYAAYLILLDLITTITRGKKEYGNFNDPPVILFSLGSSNLRTLQRYQCMFFPKPSM